MADDDATAGREIKLAKVPPFQLGNVEVVPATRQLNSGERSETVEPRVMQVLVALAEADGAVVSRDELTERCWDGVVVGENAMQRTISRIRHIATEFGQDSFGVETVTKVGYRLVRNGAGAPAPVEENAGRNWDRRLVLAGSAAVAGVAAGGYYQFRPAAAEEDTEAAMALYEKGVAIREGGSPGHTEQAVAYFREATNLAPSLSQAWGGLAFGYGEASAYSSPPEDDALAARSRSAAARALQLDPSNADARTALIVLKPLYRNWLEAEGAIAGVLRTDPNHRRATGLRAQVLAEVGRVREAVPWFQKIGGPSVFIPHARMGLLHALWSADRLYEAEDVLDEALERWPNHGMLLEARLKMLTFTGRVPAALAMLEREAAKGETDSAILGALTASARAAQSRSSVDRQQAATSWLQLVRGSKWGASDAIENLSALGALDEAFALADGYYLGRGTWAHLAVPQHKFRGWVTSILFGALTAPMRSDVRFGKLVRDIGLEAYWRQSRTQPDYRTS